MARRDVGYYSPELAKRIRDNSFAWERERQLSQPTFRQTTPNPIYVINASNILTIPALGVMQMVGTEKIDNQVFLKVDRPFDYSDSVLGQFLINEASDILPGEIGMAQFGPVYRAKSDGGTYSIGTRLGPTASAYTLSKGPAFTYLGDDDVDEDIVRIIACETPLLAIAGSSGIAANSSGQVTAKAASSGDWTAGTVTYTAWNPTGVAISSNALCLIYPVDAKWVALELC